MLTEQWQWEPLRLETGKPFRYEWPLAVNLFHQDGIGFRMRGGEGHALRLRATLYPLQNGRRNSLKRPAPK